jgi:N-acetylmuramic acid 6-phosphate etherase
MDEYNALQTEQPDSKTTTIDSGNTLDILTRINRDDRTIFDAVNAALPRIAEAVDAVYKRLASGGRLIYAGAGSSGLLGALDAFECPPTFGFPQDRILSFTAGIDTQKTYSAIEAAEDDFAEGKSLAAKHSFGKNDVVIGISASGSSQYVIGIFSGANEHGTLRVGLVNNPETAFHKHCDICIAVLTGAEVILGSTRMRAGTAQKIVLTMISTAVMIKLGLVYHNLMVGISPRNQKMRDRAERIISLACGISKEEASLWLAKADGNTRIAIVMRKTGAGIEEARTLLSNSSGNLSKALKEDTPIPREPISRGN